MKRLNFLIFSVLFGLLPIMAATPDELHGYVKDGETGEPIAGAIVKAKGSFSSTDKNGAFTLRPKEGADSVTFRCMGYEARTLPIDSDFSEVLLGRKVTRLKDVIVEAPDIYAKGDTLVFNVEKYASAKDNAIIDVIKRLPGIKVEEDGTIKYQGKPINKFYLDGNDFIGGQYGLATNNISHKEVKSVEVMENHQPVKALEGIEFPEEAGINLKLKEDARGRWVGVAQAAAGIEPFLYNASVFTMRMAPKIQNMFTLKGDNTGWNPANEIRDHDLSDIQSSDYSENIWPEYISADIIYAPLTEKRTRDNLSWLADAITAWKSGDTSMRLKFDYSGDRLDYKSGVITDYLSSDIPTFVQDNSQCTQRHEISAQFYSETNKRGYYLMDKATFSGAFGKSNSDVSGSFDLGQHTSRKNFSATNNLKLVKRNEKKLFTLLSRNSFAYRPDRLCVSGEENAVQTLGITDFRSITETQFGKLTRFWKYYLNVGLDLNYHRMNVSLSGFGDFDNNGVHTAFLSNLYAFPQVDFERNGWRISLNAPLKWLHYSIAGQHDYFNASPKFSVRRQLTAKSEFAGSISYRLTSPKPYLNFDMPVLADYRNLFIAVNPDKYSHDTSASLSYKYRNPMKSLFVNLSTSYSYHRNSMMTDQIFIDDFIISTYSGCASENHTLAVNGGVSKGLGHSKMVIGADINGAISSASSMRDNTVIPYNQFSAGVKPYFRGSITKWLSINYEADYTFSHLLVESESSDYHTFHQNLFVTIIPLDRLNFTLGAEHFLTRFPEGNTANLILLDAAAVWKINSKFRLSLTANNLLNKRNYRYINYGTLSRSEYTFLIRPRSLLLSLQYRF